MNNETKVVGYVRVSTTKQDEENQVNAIKEYCQEHEYELTRIFIDKGVSGLRKFRDRDSARELLEFIENNDVDIILVTSIDRIARDSLDLKNVIDLFKNKGIKIISLSSSEDWINYLFDNDADDVYRLVANILLETLSFFANFELKKRRERQELAWAMGKQKGRPQKISDDEILSYLKKYKKKGYTYKTIWAILNADRESKNFEKISYKTFMNRVAKLKQRGTYKEEVIINT